MGKQPGLVVLLPRDENAAFQGILRVIQSKLFHKWALIKSFPESLNAVSVLAIFVVKSLVAIRHFLVS